MTIVNNNNIVESLVFRKNVMWQRYLSFSPYRFLSGKNKMYEWNVSANMKFRKSEIVAWNFSLTNSLLEYEDIFSIFQDGNYKNDILRKWKEALYAFHRNIFIRLTSIL